MASAVHISLDELPVVTRELLERANESGEIFIDGNGTGFKISRLPGRTAAEAAGLVKNSPAANVEVDEDWASDMRDIIALRHTEPTKDPWE
jgi:hypothetical protein